MNDPVTFLREHLYEDERIALAAAGVAGPEWRHEYSISTETILLVTPQGTPLADMLHMNDEEIAPHCSRHDPARVLREVQAGRELLTQHDRYSKALARHREAQAELLADIEHEEKTGRWEGFGAQSVRRSALSREADYLTAIVPLLEKLVRDRCAAYPDWTP